MWWNRHDGDLVQGLDPDRRIMPYLMRSRNESIAYFESRVDVARTEAFLREFNCQHPGSPATLFHVVLWSLVRTLHQFPHLNRFVAGGRIYARRGIWISFAAKRELVEAAPLVTVKKRFDPDQPFADLVAEVHREVSAARSPATTSVDKELAVLLHLPGFSLRAAVALVRLADRFGLLPRVFIDPDPMFASVWVANLGSLKMDPVFHHLYEYGNTAVFCTIGQITEEPVVRDSKVVPRRIARLRFSYDERIDDGMYAGHAERLMRGLIEDPVGNGCEPSTPVGGTSPPRARGTLGTVGRGSLRHEPQV